MHTRRQLWEIIKPDVTREVLITKEPWTCVVVACEILDWTTDELTPIRGIGFSKCNVKEDVFNAGTGIDKAEGRAVQDCLDKVYALYLEHEGAFKYIKYQDMKQALQNAANCGGRVRIKYLDDFGRFSERVIRPKEVRKFTSPVDTGPYVVAFCELREEWRTFTIARMDWVQVLNS